MYLQSFNFCKCFKANFIKQSNKIPVVACYNVALCFKLTTFMTYVNVHILGHNLNDCWLCTYLRLVHTKSNFPLNLI